MAVPVMLVLAFPRPEKLSLE